MDEAFIANIIETSIVAGAFVYMLHHFLGRFSTSLENVGKTLGEVSEILIKMNSRLDNIERRMDIVEKEVI